MLMACVHPTLARDDWTRDKHLALDSFSENLDPGERWEVEEAEST